jgi:hypothetical protein
MDTLTNMAPKKLRLAVARDQRPDPQGRRLTAAPCSAGSRCRSAVALIDHARVLVAAIARSQITRGYQVIT